MPRVARVVIADVAHHVTQRGNGRQFILASEAECRVYLDLLRQAVRDHELSVVGGLAQSEPNSAMGNQVRWSMVKTDESFK